MVEVGGCSGWLEGVGGGVVIVGGWKRWVVGGGGWLEGCVGGGEISWGWEVNLD